MTPRRPGTVTTALLALGLGTALAACGPEKSHEDVVAERRAHYEARLNGFVIRQEPLPAEPGEGPLPEESGPDATASDADEAPPAVESEVALEPAPVPLRQDAVLDIEIRHDSREKLAGITLDVSHADPQGREKGHWRVWVDTSRLERGPGIQVTHVLEDVDYAENDGFHVEVRHPVPPGERGEYREFSSPGATS